MKNSSQTGIILLLCINTAVSANSKITSNEKIIETGAELQRWCQTHSSRYFRQRKFRPYNWSASTIRQLNYYKTTGSWKVNNQERHIFCQIEKGKKAKTAIMEIDSNTN